MTIPLTYHHVGIPTTVPREGEVYLDRFEDPASMISVVRID